MAGRGDENVAGVTLNAAGSFRGGIQLAPVPAPGLTLRLSTDQLF